MEGLGNTPRAMRCKSIHVRVKLSWEERSGEAQTVCNHVSGGAEDLAKLGPALRYYGSGYMILTGC